MGSGHVDGGDVGQEAARASGCLATSCVDRLIQGALDAAAGRRMTAEAERAVIADDGREIRLTTHVGAQAQAVIAIGAWPAA